MSLYVKQRSSLSSTRLPAHDGKYYNLAFDGWLPAEQPDKLDNEEFNLIVKTDGKKLRFNTIDFELADSSELFKIECNEGSPLSTWHEPHTKDEIVEKFWDYAYNEDMFDEVEEYYRGTEPLIPAWFNIPFIEDVWNVEVVPYEN